MTRLRYQNSVATVASSDADDSVESDSAERSEDFESGDYDEDDAARGCGCSCSEVSGFKTTFADVHAAERDLIDALYGKRSHALGPGKRERFALAFSGGGVRAAAFQAGILWRLACEDRLQDVEYLTAVSGGGYIASAFASHLSAAYKEDGGPQSAGDVKAWYQKVVARTIDRCRNNAGNFVRDPQGNAWSWPKDGSGVLPRIFDLPVLLSVLAYTLCISPLLYVVLFVVPAMEVIEVFWGPLMRSTFCAKALHIPTPVLMSGDGWFGSFFVSWPYTLDFAFMRTTTYHPWIAAFFTFLAWIAKWALGLCQVEVPGSRRRRPKYMRAFLFARNSMALLLRCTILLVLGIICIDLVAIWQWYGYIDVDEAAHGMTGAMCCEYVSQPQPHPCFILDSTRFMNDYLGEHTDAHCLRAYGSKTQAVLHHKMRALNTTRAEDVQADMRKYEQQAAQLEERARGLLPVIVSGVFTTLVVAWCLTPVCPGFFLLVASYAGPLLVLCTMFVAVQWRVYAPVTNQRLFRTFAFDPDWWNTMVTWCLAATFVGVPFGIRMRSTWHSYYRRTLRKNYYKGQDSTLRDIQSNPWCPFFLLTGTVNDYKPFTEPRDSVAISEIQFTALHTGSDRTGYIETSPYRTLSRCTALTGAGCLDAISLSMSDKGRYRFWLETLNLSWGSYIFFKERGEPGFSEAIASFFERRFSSHGLLCRIVRQQLRSLRSDLIMMFACIVLNIGFHYFRNADSTESCRAGKSLILLALIVLGLMIACSFFIFLQCCDFLSYSTSLRQLHQVTNYYYIGDRPPSLLYVTDGGVQDCTTILQLLRRKTKLMLLALAGADAEDDLGVLRAMMRYAAEERLASFYDIDDPSRSVAILLDEFKDRSDWTYFELGVRYGGYTDEPLHGRLVIVKHRLPPQMEGEPCELVTEEEVLGIGPSMSNGCDDLCPEDLGGLGCCDCCHRNGCNCGRKFPHLTCTGYLWLTPMLYSSLCRLGFNISGDAVRALSTRRNPTSVGEP
eukprot:TRINITY_DN21443_c0_g1_i1.p1 TRINITY_DN21443_c0_g1~~TRINITY_DN21443_c0_g1_i1.p1  ORF type:complete len:1054 (-),score=118.77 TRINITY_DN21443_c0_g1_i1:114-3134(-)